MQISAELAPLVLLSPVLIAVGYFDLRYMRIPNALSLIALALFAACCLVSVPADIVARVVAAAAVFALGFTAFAFGLVGGGDVKILTSLVLFIPIAELASFAQQFSFALAFGMAVVLALRRVSHLRHSSWAGFSETTGIPMGLPISLAGLTFPLVWGFLAQGL